jgi:UDP-glucose 4-epimerase
MRVVVVGCNGFIGKSLIEALKSRNIQCLGISKEEFDLSSNSSIQNLSSVLKTDDQIVFSSAITPSNSVTDVQKTMKMAENFCLAIEKINLKQIILISSDSVYGNNAGLFKESSPYNPDSFHGLAQVSREIIFKQLESNNLAVLRLCAVYGEKDTHNSYGPNRFVAQIKDSKPITIFGQGLNKRDHIYINDVINVIINCLILNFNGILNVVTGKTYSFQTVADICREIFNPDAIMVKSGTEGSIINKSFDTSKLIEIFPDFQAMDLRTGLSFWHNQI